MNPDDTESMAHGLLVATLSALGGSLDLRPDQLAPDAMGNTVGEFHGVELVPLPDGQIRLQLIAQHERTETERD